ncbi:MAG TPA: D-glycero-beta-D-manno-heptose 1,7-bisphosphate 7-phosphatase [Deltaproteobacteria bacterium]|nr:D-glycero-beta-D-manno-heptose 1,7-bisphosphate 7-phosphatase [Deltaproteobacteria bacterium]HOI07871.1 D-glycero-beta-D-manno-heptose 1,7-bisphosphate 7-phosphatase [Deltaproteobacteria bacterium]
MSRRAVFLDRDDTLIRDRVYLSDPDAVELMPGAAHAVSLLNRAGLPVILVTNQSGIARGFFDEERLALIHARLRSLLEEQGARIDAVYYCPHHPQGTVERFSVPCDCRKPAPGMLRQAARDFGLDLPSCFMVGDKEEDIAAIHSVGGKGILVETGKPYKRKQKPDFVTHDLVQAVQWILRCTEKNPS